MKATSLGKMFVVLGASALLLGACGGGDEATPPQSQEQGSPSEGTSEETQTGEGHVEVTVEAFDFGFEPDTISVDTGDAVHVTFSNTGQAPHTFSSEELGFDVRVDGGGGGAAGFVAPAEDGTYSFQCNIHPDQMQGTVIVGAGGGQNTEETGEGAGENDTGVDY